MFCEKCGTPLSAEASFCSSCGAPVAIPQPPTTAPQSNQPPATQQARPQSQDVLASVVQIHQPSGAALQSERPRFHFGFSYLRWLLWIVTFSFGQLVGHVIGDAAREGLTSGAALFGFGLFSFLLIPIFAAIVAVPLAFLGLLRWRPMNIIAGIVIALILGAGLGLSAEQSHHRVGNAPASGAPSSAPSENDRFAQRMRALTYACTDDAVDSKYAYVLQLYKTLSETNKPMSSFEPDVDKIWNGYGLCNDSNQPTGPKTANEFLQVMYYGDVMTVTVKLASKKYADARYHMDEWNSMTRAMRDKAKQEGWKDWLASDKEISGIMTTMDAKLTQEGYPPIPPR